MKLKHFKCYIILLLICLSQVGLGYAESRAVVTGKNAEIDKKKNTIFLQGDVVMDNAAEKMHLEADRLSLKKDPISGLVEWGEAEGDVLIVQEDLKVNTQYAVFDRKTGSSEMKRGVEVNSSEYQIIGNRLLYHMVEKNGKVTALPESQVKILFYGTPLGAPEARNEIRGRSKEILFYELAKKIILQGDVHFKEYGFPVQPEPESLPPKPTSPENSKREGKTLKEKTIKQAETQKKGKEKVVSDPDTPSDEEDSFQLAYEFEPEEEENAAQPPAFEEPVKTETPPSKNIKVPATSSVKTKRVLISKFDAQRAEVFLNKQDEVDVIIASGQVVIFQDGRTSKADRAVFNYSTEIIKLIGNAYMKEDGQIEISSSFIEMHMNVSKGIIKGKKESPVKIEIPVK